MKKLLFPLLLLISACSEQDTQPQQTVDTESFRDVTIVQNGVIYTADKAKPTVEAFAHRDGKIIASGSASSLLKSYPDAQSLDLNGATVIPGFIDAHGHLLGLGQSLMTADLMGTTSKAGIIEVLKKQAMGMPKDQWLLGRGWDQNDWEVQDLPTAADLNAAFPDRPVWLERVDGHASWGNDKAMAFAQKDLSGDWQPDGGEIVRAADGKPTGVFIDNAVNLIQSQVPAPSDAELTEALERAIAKTASVGLTSMHDAGTSLPVWRLMQKLNQQNKLNLRVYAMADGANDMLTHLCDNGTVVDPETRLTARSIKLYSDGALGSRGAALLADYSDDPSNMGLLIESEDTLTAHAKRAVGCGLQVNIHAIGDRGNRVTLNVLQAANDADNPGRHRIEHSQVIALDDFKRFKELGLIASVQPTHATSDMYWAEERVGAERIKGAYAWQKFVELDVPLALGSDFPVEKPDPLLGFYAAVARQDVKGWPEGGWYAAEALTREQALHGFTLGAAYAAFQEDQLGSISVGKHADFVVLSKDIMRVPVAEILSTEINGTYIDGKPVYRKID